MLTGITANSLARYNKATEQIEKSMNRLAKGTRDLDSHDQVRVSRFDNKIHSLKTAVVDIAKGNYAPLILKEERLRICDTCPYSGSQCEMCGCHLKTKASLLNSECPLRKW